MRFYRKHNSLIVESETLVKLAGLISSGRHGAQKAKAADFFPFIFVREQSYATPIFLNHERIHFRQQLETLFIGLLLLRIFEDLYSRLILKFTPEQTYLRRAAEQEAYLNQENLDYLKNRPWFTILHYVKNKKQIEFVPGQAPKIVVTKN